MSVEFAAPAGDNSFYTFEHDVTRIAPGELESVRARLAEALEERGFRVLNEAPLRGRRSARNNASTGCSNDILEYPATLDIGLKAVGTHSTRITFSYTINNVYAGYLTKGDRQTLNSEADALIALALARSLPSHCGNCGAEIGNSTRFCRQCGVPLSNPPVAEMEVVRLTANANASYKNLVTGAIFVALGLLFPLLIYVIKGDTMATYKLVKMLLLLPTLFCGGGLAFIVAGLLRMGRMIAPTPNTTAPTAAPRRGQAESVMELGKAPTTAALPPPPIQHPITEATTDLLAQEIKHNR